LNYTYVLIINCFWLLPNI